ncbi:hypothetical protein BLOT_014322 [Blomia tropicalis]|nr:hypothetical protein BLOT_014322 [Blomia tropicalis]
MDHDDKHCKQLQDGIGIVATIGLLSDRFICVAKYDESKEPFRVYDMPSYAFDSMNTRHIYIIQMEPIINGPI